MHSKIQAGVVGRFISVPLLLLGIEKAEQANIGGSGVGRRTRIPGLHQRGGILRPCFGSPPDALLRRIDRKQEERGIDTVQRAVQHRFALHTRHPEAEDNLFHKAEGNGRVADITA